MPTEEFDFLQDLRPEWHPPKSQLKLFSIWIDLPVEVLRDPTWKTCAAHRVRHGTRAPIAFLNPNERKRIKGAIPLCLPEKTSSPMKKVYAGISRRGGFSLLVAHEYALAEARGEFAKSHPLNQPLKESVFWELLATHHPVLRNPGALRLLKAPDGELSHVILHLLHALAVVCRRSALETEQQIPELTLHLSAVSGTQSSLLEQA